MNDDSTVDGVGGSGGDAVPAAPAGASKGKEEATETAAGLECGDAEGPSDVLDELLDSVHHRNEVWFNALLQTLSQGGAANAGNAILHALDACITLSHRDFAEKLLALAVTLHQEEHIGMLKNLFCYSAFRGRLHIVEAFIRLWPGIIFEPCPLSGKNGLDYALGAGHADVVDYLYSLGARETPDPEHATGRGENQALATGTTIFDDETAKTATSTVMMIAKRNRASKGSSHMVCRSGSEAAAGEDSTVLSICSQNSLAGHAQPEDLLDIGANIEHCNILPGPLLGQGAIGAVSVGLYKLSLVAIKVEKDRSCVSDTLFIAEAKLLRVLQVPTHPNCLGFLGVGVDTRDCVATVTEHVDGGTLAAALNNSLAIGHVQELALCAGLAAGLSYIHDTGIVHGDIKPANILLSFSEDGLRVSGKIIDFGGACAYWKGRTHHTPRYAAPEVRGGQKTEAKSDVYSLACVVYQTLTRKPLSSAREDNYAASPVEDVGRDGVVAAVESHLCLEFQTAGIGKLLAELLAQCWDTNVAKRPRSRDFFCALLGILRRLCPASVEAVETAHRCAPPCRNSPLMDAVQYADYRQIESLLNQGCSADEPNRWGRTPLHVAAALTDIRTVRLCMAPRVSSRLLLDYCGVCPVTIAQWVKAENSNADKPPSKDHETILLHMLLALEVDCEVEDDPSAQERSPSAIHSAARANDKSRAHFLLRQGVSPLVLDETGTTALNVAIAAGSVDVVGLFLNHLAAASNDVEGGMGSDSTGAIPEHQTDESAGVRGEGCVDVDWKEILTFAGQRGTPATLASVLAVLPLGEDVLTAVNALLLHAIADRSPEWVAAIVASPALASADMTAYYAAACRLSRWDILGTLLLRTRRSCQSVALSDVFIDACWTSNWDVFMLLLSRSELDINAVDEVGVTALGAACHAGHLDMVSVLLQLGAVISCNGDELRLACQGGSAAVVEQLLAKRKGSWSTDYIQEQLQACSGMGNAEVVPVLVDAAHAMDGPEAQRDINCSLVTASRCGGPDTVLALLKTGADPNAGDSEGHIPLVAASEVGDLNTVNTLLGAGAEVNGTDASGERALHAATRAGHTKVVLALLKNGADESTLGKHNDTVLMAACESGVLDLVQLFLRKEADPGRPVASGETAVHVASRLGFAEALGALVSVGGMVNHRNGNGDTALCIACELGHLNVVTALVNLGASVEATGSGGDSPLLIAVKCAHLDVVRELVKANACVSAATMSAACRTGEVDIFKALADGAEVVTVDEFGSSPLVIASQHGNAPLVAELVDGYGVSVTGVQGHEALRVACFTGYENVVSVLVRAGANVLAEDSDGTPLLVAACETGEESVVRELVAEFSPDNLRDTEGLARALVAASERGHEGTVYVLATSAAAANVVQGDGGREALLVASGGGHVGTVDVLLSAGACVEGVENSPLVAACAGGHVRVVKKLLDSGASVNATGTSDSANPLTSACESRRLDLVKLLLDRGAETAAADSRGQTAVETAIKFESTAILRALLGAERGAGRLPESLHCNLNPLQIAVETGSLETVQLLLDEYAQVPLPPRYFDNILVGAVDLGYPRIVHALLRAGAVADARGPSGESVLCIACRRGHVDVVKALTEKGGADVNQPGDDSETPLCAGSKGGSLEVVNLLTSLGANVNAAGRAGDTPLTRASGAGHEPVVEALLAAGADVNMYKEYRDTAVAIASRNGHGAVVKRLLDANANIAIPGQYGDSALMAASREAHADVVTLLLAAGGDPKFKGASKQTALTIAQEGMKTRQNRKREFESVIQILKSHNLRSESGGPAAPAAVSRQSSP